MAHGAKTTAAAGFSAATSPRSPQQTCSITFSMSTKLTVTTDENGCADLRGFYGDYTAAANGTPFTFGIHRGDAIGKTVIL